MFKNVDFLTFQNAIYPRNFLQSATNVQFRKKIVADKINVHFWEQPLH